MGDTGREVLRKDVKVLVVFIVGAAVWLNIRNRKNK